jgi:hypothetical protein
MHFHIVKMYKDKEVKDVFFVNVWRKGPCIANQLRDVNTICRRSWYIAAHVWKIYDLKIEVVPLIINFSTELTTVVKFEATWNFHSPLASWRAVVSHTALLADLFLYSYESEFLQKLVKDKKIHEAKGCTCLENLWFENWSRPAYHKF